MTEETHNAAMAGSLGIIMAIGVSAILGWFLILGLLFSIQDLQGTIDTATGEPVAQIFLVCHANKNLLQSSSYNSSQHRILWDRKAQLC
jgi:hypothetical protein